MIRNAPSSPCNPSGQEHALRAIVKAAVWANSSSDLEELLARVSEQLNDAALVLYRMSHDSGQPALRRILQYRSGHKTESFPELLAADSELFALLTEGSIHPSLAHPELPAGCRSILLRNRSLKDDESQGNTEMSGVLLVGFGEANTLCDTQLRSVAVHLLRASERLRDQDRLERHRKALHQLFACTRESFAQWSRQQGWEYHNAHLLHRLGYQADAMPLKNIFGNPLAIAAEEWKRLCAMLEDCIAQGRDIECEYQVAAADGSQRTFWTRLRVLEKNNRGGAEGLAAVSVDVTESREIEADAKAHAELESWLLARNSELFNGCDKTAIEDTLMALGQRLGLSRCFIRVYKDDKAPVYAEWQKAGVTPISVVNPDLNTIRPHARDARPAYIADMESSTKTRPLLPFSRRASVRAQMLIPMSHDGHLHGYLVCQDDDVRHWSTLEKRAARILADTLCMVLVKENLRQKLLASQEQFQLALTAASYGVWEFNILEQTIYLSPTYYQTLGYGADKAIGFRALTLDNVYYEDRRTLRDYARGLSNGSTTEFACEARHIGSDGDVRWMLMRGRTIKWDDTGKPLRAMGTMTDITALKSAQLDLLLARKAAESAHLAKSEFLARMSHEIRTPMNAIIGMAYLALQSPLSAEQCAYITDIDNAAKSLLRIIDDILDFSKIEAGKLVLENYRFDLRKELQELLVPFESQSRQRRLGFSIDVAPNVPAFIWGDATRLRQVLANLLGNALKFTREGAVRLTVEVLSQVGDSVRLGFIVSDTGIGFDPANLERLFDPFTQADNSSTRQFGGTGLGLAICRQLVNMMGGDFMVSSAPGMGSAFRFALQNRADSELGQMQSHKGAGPSALEGKRVLLVEDNAVNQKVAAGILRRKGVVVIIAETGTEAIDLLNTRGERFDAILMDIEMPEMDGVAATRAIRCNPQHARLPIIAMTAHGSQDRRRFMDADMTDLLSKPVIPDALYTVLERHLTSPPELAPL